MASVVKLQVIQVANVDIPTEVTTWLAANPLTNLWQVVVSENVFYLFYT